MTLFQADPYFVATNGGNTRKAENDTIVHQARMAFIKAARNIFDEVGELPVCSDFRFIKATDKTEKAIRKLADSFVFNGIPFTLELDYECVEEVYTDYYSVEVASDLLESAFHTYLKENGVNLFERRLVIKDYPALDDYEAISEISDKLKKLVEDFRYHGLHVDCLEYMGGIEVWIV